MLVLSLEKLFSEFTVQPLCFSGMFIKIYILNDESFFSLHLVQSSFDFCLPGTSLVISWSVPSGFVFTFGEIHIVSVLRSIFYVSGKSLLFHYRPS